MRFELIGLLVVIAVLALMVWTALMAWTALKGKHSAKFPRWRRRGIALANDPQDGVHMGGRFTRRADGALGRNLLAKAGSDANHVVVAGAADVNLVVTQDEAEAAEDLINCQMLACADRTVRLQTDGSGAIVYGDTLVPAAAGQVKKIAVGAGNYYVVGYARTAPVTAAGELLEVEPYGGYKTQ